MSIENSAVFNPAINDNEHDFEVAMDAAKHAELQANTIVVETIQSMCDTPEQEMIAQALVTAAMLDKYERASHASPNFRRVVGQIRKTFGKRFNERLDATFGPVGQWTFEEGEPETTESRGWSWPEIIFVVGSVTIAAAVSFGPALVKLIS